MGYHATVSADGDALIGQEQAGSVAPSGDAAPRAAVSAYAWRNGRVIPVSLETTATAPRLHQAVPEQVIIAALLLVSFIAPIFHVLG